MEILRESVCGVIMSNENVMEGLNLGAKMIVEVCSAKGLDISSKDVDLVVQGNVIEFTLLGTAIKTLGNYLWVTRLTAEGETVDTINIDMLIMALALEAPIKIAFLNDHNAIISQAEALVSGITVGEDVLEILWEGTSFREVKYETENLREFAKRAIRNGVNKVVRELGATTTVTKITLECQKLADVLGIVNIASGVTLTKIKENRLTSGDAKAELLRSKMLTLDVRDDKVIEVSQLAEMITNDDVKIKLSEMYNIPKKDEEAVLPANCTWW